MRLILGGSSPRSLVRLGISCPGLPPSLLVKLPPIPSTGLNSSFYFKFYFFPSRLCWLVRTQTQMLMRQKARANCCEIHNCLALTGLMLILVCSFSGIMLAQFHTSLAMQFASVVVLGIANTIAGWLSHDYTHGRSKFHMFMRPFGEFCGGMSTTWWSDKHNTHHARTNEVGHD
jgi:hypothetical protein